MGSGLPQQMGDRKWPQTQAAGGSRVRPEVMRWVGEQGQREHRLGGQGWTLGSVPAGSPDGFGGSSPGPSPEAAGARIGGVSLAPGLCPVPPLPPLPPAGDSRWASGAGPGPPTLQASMEQTEVLLLLLVGCENREDGWGGSKTSTAGRTPQYCKWCQQSRQGAGPSPSSKVVGG